MHLDFALSEATPADSARLFEVWESSVRATHHFLSEADHAELAPLVQELLTRYAPIHVLRDQQGRAHAFLGVNAGAIDMLFVHAD
ncbi:MAG TPA: hypothetical protein VFF16_08920, partial [Telluria sp.]|nr:hypothetical protein [Telluria sp.]